MNCLVETKISNDFHKLAIIIIPVVGSKSGQRVGWLLDLPETINHP